MGAGITGLREPGAARVRLSDSERASGAETRGPRTQHSDGDRRGEKSGEFLTPGAPLGGPGSAREEVMERIR